MNLALSRVLVPSGLKATTALTCLGKKVDTLMII